MIYRETRAVSIRRCIVTAVGAAARAAARAAAGGLAALVVVVSGGCGGDDGSHERNETPLLEITPRPTAGTFTVALGSVAPGEETWVDAAAVNVGEVPLTITAFEWAYTAPDGAAEDAPAFTCVRGADDVPCGEAAGLPIRIGVLNQAGDLPDRLPLRVRFLRPADDAPRAATLTIRCDSRSGDVTVRFDTDEATPRVQVTPDHVRFKGLRRDELGRAEVTVWNGGSADLIVDRLTLTADPEFEVALGDERWTETARTRAGVAIDPPLVIGPDRSERLEVTYRARDREGASGTLALHTNDPAADWVTVRLEAEQTGPVLDTNPRELPFGARFVGREAALPLLVLSTGTEPVTVSAIAFAEGSSGDFSVTLADGGPVADALPLVVLPNDRVELAVHYLPDVENDVDELTGAPVLDEGTLVLESDGFEPRLEVPVSGWGARIDCPLAIITCEEGQEVVPQTTLHLDGSQSVGMTGRIVEWEWRVDQPGTGDVFTPSPRFPSPSFEANAAGSYTFYLDVWDEGGTKSCDPAVYEVVVIPDNAIHVELLWTTPGDPDETDTGLMAGADVDLHFLHPDAPSDPAAADLDGDGAPDPWFDMPFDCYFYNSQPNWASQASQEDDPRLDRDDTDGAGPENLNLDVPEDDTRYTVAVHYWNDHGYGASFATVRFYIYGFPVEVDFTAENVRLVNGDLWCVAHIDWPSGEITRCEAPGGGLWIVPDYRHPMFDW